MFSGAGGLTFGFYYKLQNGKFIRNRKNQFLFANEYSPVAAEAFRLNYPDINMIQGDIRTLSEDKINDLLQDDEVDLIIGGPPCQSFSTVGMRRFDEQAKLYKEYLRLLSIIKPKMFLFENVTGILSMREIFYKIDAMGELRYEEIKTIRGGKEIVRRKPIVDHYGDSVSYTHLTLPTIGG